MCVLQTQGPEYSLCSHLLGVLQQHTQSVGGVGALCGCDDNLETRTVTIMCKQRLCLARGLTSLCTDFI